MFTVNFLMYIHSDLSFCSSSFYTSWRDVLPTKCRSRSQALQRLFFECTPSRKWTSGNAHYKNKKQGSRVVKMHLKKNHLQITSCLWMHLTSLNMYQKVPLQRMKCSISMTNHREHTKRRPGSPELIANPTTPIDLVISTQGYSSHFKDVRGANVCKIAMRNFLVKGNWRITPPPKKLQHGTKSMISIRGTMFTVKDANQALQSDNPCCWCRRESPHSRVLLLWLNAPACNPNASNMHSNFLNTYIDRWPP